MSSLDQDLLKLVREVVKAELNASRTNATEIVGRGGDTVISSMRNVYIRPGANGKAYYNDTEIGSGSGNSSISGTTNKIAKFTSASAVGNSNVTDDGSNVTSSTPINLSDSNTYLENSSGNIHIHVASGKKVSIVVG